MEVSLVFGLIGVLSSVKRAQGRTGSRTRRVCVGGGGVGWGRQGLPFAGATDESPNSRCSLLDLLRVTRLGLSEASLGGVSCSCFGVSQLKLNTDHRNPTPTLKVSLNPRDHHTLLVHIPQHTNHSVHCSSCCGSDL